MGIIFKKPNFQIKTELLKGINDSAYSLGLYNPRVDIDQQPAGYNYFKSLCLHKGTLTDSYPAGDENGYYSFMKLHPNIRNEAWICVKYVRDKFSIQKKNQ